MLKKVLLLVVGLTLGVSLLAETKRVAILPSVDKVGNMDYLRKFQITKAIGTGITLTEGYEAYDRIDLDSILGEQKFQRSGMVTDQEIKKIGEMTGAKYVLISELVYDTANPNVVWMSAQFDHVETGEIVNSIFEYLEIDTPEKLKQGCIEMVKKLLRAPGSPDLGGGSSRPGMPNDSSSSNYTEDAYHLNMKMVFVQGGEFQMGATSEQGGGDSDENPIRWVTVGDFFIGQFEVTQYQWESVMGTSISYQRNLASSSSSLYGAGPDYPMYYVSWEEATEFCRILSRKTGRKYSLPTEAEWEYAARGGNKSDRTKFAGSNIVDRVGWYTGNSSSSTHSVGQKESNELGLYDMSGNVWEWCLDWYANSYDRNDVNNPQGPASGSGRVLRGGSWYFDASGCRVAYRNRNSPGSRCSNSGFRVVCRP